MSPKGRLQLVFRAALRSLLEGVASVLPPRRHVAVYGIPDLEGNAVEIVRWLLSHDDSTIVWLTGTGEWQAVARAVDDIPHHERLRVVRKRSIRGIVSYLTAGTVFFTHRLFLSPRPVRGRIYVNVWHGDGPKLVGSLAPTKPADSLVVAGTALWGVRKARAFGLDEGRLAVVGNPRIDQFLRPAEDESLVQLGVDPERPFVVWAPTFREAVFGRLRWSDTELLSRGSAGEELRRLAWSQAGSEGPQVVVKPHPLDHDDYGHYGLRVLDECALSRARVTFYQLLARSAGLVTDYSSIWTDYLPLDRPIGYYCPDLDEYARARDLDVEEFRGLLAGPLMSSPSEMLEFCEAVMRGEDPGVVERGAAVGKLGAVVELGATGRLMEECEKRRGR